MMMAELQTGSSPGPMAARPGKLLAPLSGGLAFVLVLPPAPVSLMLVLVLCAALPLWRHLFAARPWREPTLAIGLALFAWIAVHTLWTSGSDWKQALQAINRYHELLLALLLVPIFMASDRKDLFLRGLAAGALVWAALHWIALAHEPMAQYLAKRRISAGWTLAVAAFLLLVYAPSLARPWLWRGGAVALALTVLFAISGRTGHVTILVLFALAAALQVRSRRALLGALLVAAILLGAAATSSRLKDRLAEVADASYALDRPVVTSSEIRIQLSLTTLEVIRQHGWAGVGYVRFPSLYADAVADRVHGLPSAQARLSENWAQSDNPHNEYLLQLAAAGVVGLLLFTAWLFAPLLRDGPPHVRHALVGLVVAFSLGCLFNSLLKDFVEGHYFIVTLSWLLAQAKRA